MNAIEVHRKLASERVARVRISFVTRGFGLGGFFECEWIELETIMKTIIACVDFSDLTPAVVATAAGFAVAGKATLHLLHIYSLALPVPEMDTLAFARKADAQ